MAKQAARLTKEMTDLTNNPVEGVKVEIVGDQVTNWNVHILGPVSFSRSLKLSSQNDCPYAGGQFTVNVDFSDNYPFKCPKVLFKTKIYHPNIKQETGEICQQAIENNWVPTQNARFIIESVVTLLKNPNADNPLEAEIAELFAKDYNAFCARAKEFTASYAK